MNDLRPDLDYVRWEGEDSTFEGYIVARYPKLSDKRMVVIEDVATRLNHIYPDNPKRLTILRSAIIADPLPKDGEAGESLSHLKHLTVNRRANRPGLDAGAWFCLTDIERALAEADARVADLERERDEARSKNDEFKRANIMLGQAVDRQQDAINLLNASAARLRKAVEEAEAYVVRVVGHINNGDEASIPGAKVLAWLAKITAALQTEPGKTE